jgi:hypothetical protein
MEAVTTRQSIYKELKGLDTFTDIEVRDLMDGGIPYQPEESNYKVASIVRG